MLYSVLFEYIHRNVNDVQGVCGSEWLQWSHSISLLLLMDVAYGLFYSHRGRIRHEI